MKGFRARLAWAFDNSNFADKREFSTVAGMGEKTFYNILSDERLDTSQTGPGFFAMARCASLLGVSLDFLAGTAPPPNSNKLTSDSQLHSMLQHVVATSPAQEVVEGSPPSVDAILRLHHRSGGVLAGLSPVIEFCDQYAIPKNGDETFKVISVGSKSLAALTMGKKCPETLQNALNTVDNAKFRQNLLQDYRLAAARGSLCSIEALNIQMPNMPVRVKMDYVRALLCVTGADDQRSIVNFSTLIV